MLDVPEDVCHGEHDFDAADFWVDEGTLKAQARRTRPDPDELERAAAIIAKAERPLLLVGGGIHISEGYDALLALAEGFGIPVAHTMSGKGAIACTHPLSAGLFGRYSRIANDLVAASDALIVVGCKLGEIPTQRFQLIPPGKPLIHIDILAEEIGRTTRTDVALVGDARLALQDLAAALADGGKARARRASPGAPRCPSRMAKWREGAADRLQVEREADQCRPPDGRAERHHAGRRDPGRRRRLRRRTGAGCCSTPSAPAATSSPTAASPRSATACPARWARSWRRRSAASSALTGDGGFNMTLGELETARRAGTPFVLCVFNNAASGYVKALQHSMFGAGNYQSSDLVEMDYAAITRAMGCKGIRVDDPEQARAARCARGWRTPTTPTVLDIVVTRDPAKMLPGVDNRTLVVTKGDRPV